MNANEVVEAYVNDVAVQLPRKQRNDVAFELRALLNEELQARAEESGRPADANTTIEFLQAFGRPEDVAARYRPTLIIIDPAYGHAFLRLSVIGLLVIWTLGLISQFQQPIDSVGPFLTALGRWWLSTVVASLWWPGVLVAYFALASWTHRTWPKSTWKPVAVDHVHGGRAAMVMGLIAATCGLALLFEPRWVLDAVWGGKAAPAAYEALTYVDAFRRGTGTWLWLLVATNIPLFATVIVINRWTTLLRRLQLVLALATCVLMAWAVVGGPIFIRPASDSMTKALLVLIIVLTLLDLGIKLLRNVKPTPDRMGPRLTG